TLPTKELLVLGTGHAPYDRFVIEARKLLQPPEQVAAAGRRLGDHKGTKRRLKHKEYIVIERAFVRRSDQHPSDLVPEDRLAPTIRAQAANTALVSGNGRYVVKRQVRESRFQPTHQTHSRSPPRRLTLFNMLQPDNTGSRKPSQTKSFFLLDIMKDTFCALSLAGTRARDSRTASAA